MSESDIILLLEQRWVGRDELASLLDCSERSSRVFIEELNRKLEPYGKCVLSLSSRKGYHIANPDSEEDLAIAVQADKELESKAIAIFERRKVILNYIKLCQKQEQRPIQKGEQLSLF